MEEVVGEGAGDCKRHTLYSGQAVNFKEELHEEVPEIVSQPLSKALPTQAERV